MYIDIIVILRTLYKYKHMYHTTQVQTSLQNYMLCQFQEERTYAVNQLNLWRLPDSFLKGKINPREQRDFNFHSEEIIEVLEDFMEWYVDAWSLITILPELGSTSARVFRTHANAREHTRQLQSRSMVCIFKEITLMLLLSLSVSLCISVSVSMCYLLCLYVKIYIYIYVYERKRLYT